MKLPETKNQLHIRIKPGEYLASRQSVIISTVLGSCVAACLYDPVQKVIGMNHFLLSNRRYARNMPYYVTEAGRYGIHAMEILINEMLKLGARRENLRAKAFGGASLFQPSGEAGNFFCVGEVNSKFIREFLETEGVPLVTSDLGGDRGRAIHFHYDDFSVYVRKIQKTVNKKLGLKEKQFWQRSMEIQEQKAVESDIWLSDM
ncbi:MAG: chemotaxis protein CheD [Nitrospirae bacterium]|nr:chemotaxis protein CheD [Nitrospirota bacterium]